MFFCKEKLLMNKLKKQHINEMNKFARFEYEFGHGSGLC